TTITKVGFDGKIIAQRTAANIPNDWEVIDTHKSALLCRSLKPPASDFFVTDEASGIALHAYQASRENYPKARIERGVACVIDGGNMTAFDIESKRATSRQVGDKGMIFGETSNLKAASVKGETMEIADANKTALCGDIGKTWPTRHKGAPSAQFAEDGYIYSFYVGLFSQLFLGLFYHPVFIITFVIALLFKFLFEFRILYKGKQILFDDLRLKYFYAAEIFQIPYIIYSGLVGAFGNYLWKSRKVKR
ncbi:MAG: hypothetical protein MUE91_05850, partial [Ignavibacteriaceae bacterium]|nr:hypothetical protein [Ignavibacteriaceae bacterium]